MYYWGYPTGSILQTGLHHTALSLHWTLNHIGMGNKRLVGIALLLVEQDATSAYNAVSNFNRINQAKSMPILERVANQLSCSIVHGSQSGVAMSGPHFISRHI